MSPCLSRPVWSSPERSWAGEQTGAPGPAEAAVWGGCWGRCRPSGQQGRRKQGGKSQVSVASSSPSLPPGRDHAPSLPRTGGTAPPSPATTAPGTWWSTTGCTAMCTRTGCGYGPHQQETLSLLLSHWVCPLLDLRALLAQCAPVQWVSLPAFPLDSSLTIPQGTHV